MTLEELCALLAVAHGPGEPFPKDVHVGLETEGLAVADREHDRVLLTERGRVFVEHLLSQPLPVATWSMPGAIDASRGPSRPVPKTNLQPSGADSAAAEEDTPPPRPPVPKPIPSVTPAQDEPGRREQARKLIEQGYGTSEVAETLGLEHATVEAIFFGGA